MNRSRPLPLIGCLLAGIGVFLSSCLQLETPHSFSEQEETKMRAKNVHQYYKDLEEQIQRELHLIKLLQDTLNLHITSEQTLSKEVEKRGKIVEQKRSDLMALNNEVKAIDQKLQNLSTQLEEKKKKQQELEAALKAVQEKIAAQEQNQAEEQPEPVAATPDKPETPPEDPNKTPAAGPQDAVNPSPEKTKETPAAVPQGAANPPPEKRKEGGAEAQALDRAENAPGGEKKPPHGKPRANFR